MTFKTLEKTNKEIIRQTLNLGFSDYSIPLQFSPQQWDSKITAENIKWEWSVGAFDGDNLVGAILHAEKRRATSYFVYNAGTAVIPSHRGNQLTRKMYEFILPILKAASFKSITLEVIDNNLPALTSYNAVGFKIKRELECYKGYIKYPKMENKYNIKPLTTLDLSLVKSFWDISPSWQNDIEAIENSKKELSSLGAYHNEELSGYIVFNPNTSRILQLAVAPKHRGKKIGSALLSQVMSAKEQLLVITNVDNSNHAIISWLQTRNLNNFVNLFEMELQLK